MAPVTLFGTAVYANAARVLACLDEVGAEYDVVDIDYMAKEHKAAHHLGRNPFGQIPAFQDGELVLFESRAIAKYVLRKYGKRGDEADLLREGDPEAAAAVDVWTEVEAHQYFPAIAPVVYECVIYPAKHGTTPDQAVVEESLAKLRAVLEVYEARLSGRRFLADDFFSFADLSHFPYTYYFMKSSHAALFDEYPCVKAWWEDVMARPSVRRTTAGMVITRTA